MVRMGASAPLLLSGLRRPLRVGADGVQRPDATIRSFSSGANGRGGDVRTGVRAHAATNGHTRHHADATTLPRTTLRTTDVRHGELFLGAVPPNPHILALRARFRTRDAVTRIYPTFFRVLRRKTPARPPGIDPPKSEVNGRNLANFCNFLPKNFIWTLSEKKF